VVSWNGTAPRPYENLTHGVDAFAQADRLRIDVLSPREGQKLAGQRGSPLAGRIDRLNGALGFLVPAYFLKPGRCRQ